MAGLLTVLIIGFISGLILMFLYTQLLEKGLVYFKLVIAGTTIIFSEIAFLILPFLPDTPAWVLILSIPYIAVMGSCLSYLAYFIVDYQNMKSRQRK